MVTPIGKIWSEKDSRMFKHITLSRETTSKLLLTGWKVTHAHDHLAWVCVSIQNSFFFSADNIHIDDKFFLFCFQERNYHGMKPT